MYVGAKMRSKYSMGASLVTYTDEYRIMYITNMCRPVWHLDKYVVSCDHCYDIAEHVNVVVCSLGSQRD